MGKHIVSEILSLEYRIEKLNEIADKMLANNGMCKTYALEALKIVPNFNNNTPMAFYSNDIGVSQYRVSMESIVDSVWKFILECLVKIKNYIKSIISLLLSKKQESKTKDIVSFLTKNRDIGGSNQEGLKILSEILNTAANHKQTNVSTEDAIGDFKHYSKVRTIDELVEVYLKYEGVDSHLAELMNDKEPLFQDICNRGSYYSIINTTKSGIVQLNKYFSNIKENINLINSVISNESFPTGKLLGIDQYRVTGIRVPNIEEPTFSDINKLIAASRENVINNKNSNNKLSYTKLNAAFTGSVEALDYNATMNIIIKINTYINTLNDDLEKLISKVESVTKIKDDTRIANSVNKAISIIRSDIVGGIGYIKELWNYSNTLLRMHKRLVEANNEVLKIITSDLKNVYGNIPADLWDRYLDAKNKLSKTI